MFENQPDLLTVIYQVRGRQRRSELKVECRSLAEIIDRGEQHFPLFLARNPWISVDSRSNTVYVGIDSQRSPL